MLIRGAEPVSCFGLAGCDENAGTYALGWCLEQSPALRAELFGSLGLDPLAQVTLSSQNFGMEDRGFTDLEVLSGTAFHLVFEAKRHWQVTTRAQLARYVNRLADSNVQHKRLISVSAARKDWAVRHLPQTSTASPSITSPGQKSEPWRSGLIRRPGTKSNACGWTSLPCTYRSME